MEFKWFVDSGHAWLGVPMSEVIRVGVHLDISKYSFVSQSTRTVYLEEDLDAGVFVQAYGREEFLALSVLDDYQDGMRQDIRGLRRFGLLAVADYQTDYT